MEGIENNFENVDLFENLMSALEEILADETAERNKGSKIDFSISDYQN